MDSIAILLEITECRYLRHRFVGVFSADTIPIPLNNTFIIVNSENSDEEGKNWLLICNKGGIHLFGDPIGLRLDAYKKVEKRLTHEDFSQELIQKPLQQHTSNLGGLYCIYIARYVFSGYYPVIPLLIDDERLLRFVKQL